MKAMYKATDIVRKSLSSFMFVQNGASGIRYISTNYHPGKGVFADPSYDLTFKMLFGVEEHKPLLISLLNSLLGFKGVKVEEVELLPSMILPEYDRNLRAEIDIKCRLSDSKEILVEMQRASTKYFLPRTQYYMGKALSLQMKDGEGELHHKVLLPTYMLVIAGKPIFTKFNTGNPLFGKKEDIYYEKTVIPYIEEMKIPFPIKYNRMFWKFYELSKFDDLQKQGKIDLNTPKHQWLDFINNCAFKEEIPKGVMPEIEAAYKIMEKHTWSADQKMQYDLTMQQMNKDEIDIYSFFDAEIEGVAEKARAEGKIQAAASAIITLIKERLAIKTISKASGVPVEKIEQIQQLNQQKNLSVDEIIDIISPLTEEPGSIERDDSIQLAGDVASDFSDSDN